MTTHSPQMPLAAYETFRDEFIRRVEEIAAEQDLMAYEAIPQHCMSIWGLDAEDGASKSDGKGDRGIDWYRIQSDSTDIWQFKGVSEINAEALQGKVCPGDLSDMRRILDYLQTIHNSKETQNRRVRRFQNKLAVSLKAKSESPDPVYFIYLHYVVTKSDLTVQAMSELEEIKQTAKQITEIGRVLVEVEIKLILIGDVIEEIWRQTNSKWDVPLSGRNAWVELEHNGQIIDDKKCLVFYARAFDLIKSYEQFGQRLFAPNVRCFLKETTVNAKIRQTVMTAKGVDNFRYMNNGVTITAENVQKLGSQKVKVMKPGVVNGLQTIRSLHNAYSFMGPEEKSYFESNCYLITRVFGSKKLGFSVEDLIVATNNQNKMEPRNLHSNTHTQKIIEHEFSNLGWFYERKEKAWEAFVESDGKWDTLPGKKAANFGGTTKARRKAVDNEVVATSVLAFSGFSETARSRKRDIFSNEKLYSRVFESQILNHGFTYDFSFKNADDLNEVMDQIPSASVMLLATLVYLSAKQIGPTSAEVARTFVEQHNLQSEPKERQQAVLLDDPEYLAALMVSSAPFLFTEIYGYLFYQIPPEERSAAARIILKKSDLSVVYEKKDYTALASSMSNDPSEHDLFNATYRLTRNIFAEHASTANFRSDLTAASSRPSFLHSTSTRKKFFARLIELEEHLGKTGSLMKRWSSPFDHTGSIVKSLREFARKN